MDLLLRWVTLHFFETNTTVNLKCLEFLQAAFKMLTRDGNYRMTDYEANTFLPYLVTKVLLYVVCFVNLYENFQTSLNFIHLMYNFIFAQDNWYA